MMEEAAPAPAPAMATAREGGLLGARRSAREKEKTKLRERQRRSITTKIVQGLRKHGGYRLSPRADINQVLRQLAKEAGWTVDPDGTAYRSKVLSHCPLCGAMKSNGAPTPTSSVTGGGVGGGGESSTTASPPRRIPFGEPVLMNSFPASAYFGGGSGGGGGGYGVNASGVSSSLDLIMLSGSTPPRPPAVDASTSAVVADAYQRR